MMGSVFSCEIQAIYETHGCMDVVFTYEDGSKQLIGVAIPADISKLPFVLSQFSNVDWWDYFQPASEVSLSLNTVFNFVKVEPVISPIDVEQLASDFKQFFTLPTTEF
jgi:hypothetical protein